MQTKAILFGLFTILLLSGCSSPGKVDLPDPETAESIVPELDGYTNTPITDEVALGITYLGDAASKTAEPSLVTAGLVTKKIGIFLECYKTNSGVEIQLISAENDIYDQSIIAVGEENLGKILQCVAVSLPPGSIVTKQKQYGIYASKCRIQDKSTWDIVVLSSVKETIEELNKKIPGCADAEIIKYIEYA